MAGAGKLNIDIEVRLDKLESGLKRVEDRVAQTGKKVDAAGGKFDSMAKAMGGITKIATKLVAVVGIVDGAIKGATAQVHMMRGAWALMKGDTDGAMKSLEKYGETIRSLPILGGILGGIADGIVGLADAIFGWSEEQEKLDKLLAKGKQLSHVVAIAKGINKGNQELQKQIEILKETSDVTKANLTLEMQLAALDEKAKHMKVEIRRNAEKGTRERQVGLRVIDEQIALEKEILSIKHQQAAEEREFAEAQAAAAKEAERLANLAAGDDQIKLAMQTMGALEDQLKIQLAQTEQEKIKAMLVAQQNQLSDQFNERQKDILENETLTAGQQEKLLALLRDEYGLKMDLIRLAAEARQKAIEEAEQQKKKTDQLKEQKEVLEEQ